MFVIRKKRTEGNGATNGKPTGILSEWVIQNIHEHGNSSSNVTGVYVSIQYTWCSTFKRMRLLAPHSGWTDTRRLLWQLRRISWHQRQTNFCHRSSLHGRLIVITVDLGKEIPSCLFWIAWLIELRETSKTRCATEGFKLSELSFDCNRCPSVACSFKVL